MGAKQESLWYWVDSLGTPAIEEGDETPYDKICSAFTAAEGLESLPYMIKGIGQLQIYKDENGWVIGYDPHCVEVAASSKKLADACVKLRIHLIEKGIVKV